MVNLLRNGKTDLSKKALEIYPNVIVNKKIASQQGINRLPRFVSEYLIMKFCEDDLSSDSIEKISTFIRKYYPHRNEKEKTKAQLIRLRSIQIIDDFRVETDVRRNDFKVIIPTLDIPNATLVESILHEHENLLLDGLWGIGKLVYISSSSGGNEVRLTEFSPFQVSKIEIEEFMEKREYFTFEEWIDLLINSIGLNPDVYDYESKLILLSRLVPLVESNTNMIELGPKGTGKTYLFRNISAHTRIISGGQISPAALFVNNRNNSLGLLATKDLVVFDEISTTKLTDSGDTIGKLKDFMESGQFTRGKKQIASNSSVIMIGNITIKNDQPIVVPYFGILPKDMQDTALLDRLHGFIPGWELKRIKQSVEHLSSSYGFVSDYFAEILHKLREFDFSMHIVENVKLVNFDIRDEKSVKKICSGLLKLLFPHGRITQENLKLCLDIAIRYRQIVIDQLHHMDAEFKKKKLSYEFIK